LGQQLSREAISRQALEERSFRRDLIGKAETAIRKESEDAADAVDRRRSIADTIERDIVPRLVRARAARVASDAGRAVETETVTDFVAILLHCDPAGPASFVERQIGSGVAIEAIYLDLLAPAARQLGDMWTDDRVDFTEVMLGLAKLQALLHEFSPPNEPAAARGSGQRVLLACAPGEHHIFGIVMVDEFFRRAGWDTRCLAAATAADIVANVRRDSYAIVGFSASCDYQLEPLANCIRFVRKASRNRAVGVLVGGRLFVERPELVSLVGADTSAIDGRQAVLQASDLTDALSGRA
jgi:methanogenic corrinoid protein MtbC1